MRAVRDLRRRRQRNRLADIEWFEAAYRVYVVALFGGGGVLWVSALLGETDEHLDRLEVLLTQSGVRGGGVHDARIAAICLEHGVTELWSVDRDFQRFPGLRVVNPLSA